MRIEYGYKLGFKDVLVRPKRSALNSRAEVSLNRQYTFKNSGYVWNGVPIIAANMDTVGTFNMALALHKYQLMTAIHKHYTTQQWREFLRAVPAKFFDHIAISTGVTNQDYEHLINIIQMYPEIKFICIDVANGYTESFVNHVKKVRNQFSKQVIIAGNVATGEMVEELLISGADIVKVGIGPGSVCTTRLKTGVGYPQLSAVIECADAAHGLKGHIISDGGCTSSGDVAKAFGAGADFVMLGGMLSGHDENDGELIEIASEKYMEFYGMSSKTAMDKHNGGVAHYRASEGKTVRVRYKGPVDATVLDMLGGVRSACTYVGASCLKELSKCTTFIQVMEQENQVFA